AASLVAKVPQGTAPADLPVEQVSNFQFAVNFKPAKAIGVTLPTSILLRADIQGRRFAFNAAVCTRIPRPPIASGDGQGLRRSARPSPKQRAKSKAETAGPTRSYAPAFAATSFPTETKTPGMKLAADTWSSNSRIVTT